MTVRAAGACYLTVGSSTLDLLDQARDDSERTMALGLVASAERAFAVLVADAAQGGAGAPVRGG